MTPQPEAPSEIQRYDILVDSHEVHEEVTHYRLKSIADETGDWVHHSDHEAAMKEAIEVIKLLSTDLDPNEPECGIHCDHWQETLAKARAFLQSKGVKA